MEGTADRSGCCIPLSGSWIDWYVWCHSRQDGSAVAEGSIHHDYKGHDDSCSYFVAVDAVADVAVAVMEVHKGHPNNFHNCFVQDSLGSSVQSYC